MQVVGVKVKSCERGNECSNTWCLLMQYFRYFYIMTTTAIIKEINKLPLAEQLLLVEKTLKTIRQQKEHQMDVAVNALYNDYATNKELTIFTKLDSEPFYESR